MILKIPELLDIVDEFVETDLTYGQMVTLARFGIGIDREDISTATLEGVPVNGVKIGRDKVSVYKIDEKFAKEVSLRSEVVESEDSVENGSTNVSNKDNDEKNDKRNLDSNNDRESKKQGKKKK